MLYISPSILAADFAFLQRDCAAAVAGGADMLHIDVMDGHFVPNITIGAPVLAAVKKAVPDTVYDVHLMIDDPMRYIGDFARAGADIITFHYEAGSDPDRTIEEIHRCGCRAGISIKPGTPVEVIFPFLPKVDMVLVMTVEPGFGGQQFMQDMCQKLFALHLKAQELALDKLLIEVDGGIDKYTSQLAVTAGANVLVAGSAVFKKDNITEAIAAIRSSCEGEQ